MVCPYFHSKQSRMKLRPDIYELSKRLVKRGHKVVALASKAYGAPSYEIVDGIKVYRIPAITLPNVFYFIPSFPHLVNTLLKICKEHSIQIVHFWNYEYLTSTVAFLLRKKLTNLSFVLTVIGFPGLNWHYGVRAVDTVGFIYTYTIGRLILRAVDHVVVLGRSLIKYARWMGIPDNKVSVCPIGIDLETFRPTKSSRDIRDEFGIVSSDIVITFVGRLEPVKGVAYLLEAADHLCNRFENIKFLIVGDGPLRSKFEKHSNRRIIFAGWRNDVVNMLNAADIFVLPSIAEGLPISILEAYALAKPVIVTNVGAVPDLVSNGESGLLIAPRSWEQIEEAIRYLIDNPSIAQAMGVNGQEFIKRYHDWDYVIKKYEEIYGLSKHRC